MRWVRTRVRMFHLLLLPLIGRFTALLGFPSRFLVLLSPQRTSRSLLEPRGNSLYLRDEFSEGGSGPRSGENDELSPFKLLSNARILSAHPSPFRIAFQVYVNDISVRFQEV